MCFDSVAIHGFSRMAVSWRFPDAPALAAWMGLAQGFSRNACFPDEMGAQIWGSRSGLAHNRFLLS